MPLRVDTSGSPRSAVRSSCSSPRCNPPPAPAASPRSVPNSPMSADAYARLLSKSQVLEQLSALRSSASTREAALAELERAQSRSDSVASRSAADLAVARQQCYDARRDQSEMIAAVSDLIAGKRSIELGGDAGDDTSSDGSNVKEQGRACVRKLCDLLTRQDRQLANLEQDLARSMNSGQVEREIQAMRQRLQELEAREQYLTTENATLSESLASAQRREEGTADQLKALQDCHTALDAAKRQADQQLDDQRDALVQFGTALRAEMRRRYGAAPAMLELRWREFFPDTALPL